MLGVHPQDWTLLNFLAVGIIDAHFRAVFMWWLEDQTQGLVYLPGPCIMNICDGLEPRPHASTLNTEPHIQPSFFCLLFLNKISLCSPGSPKTHCIDQSDFNLTEIHLHPPLGLKT